MRCCSCNYGILCSATQGIVKWNLPLEKKDLPRMISDLSIAHSYWVPCQIFMMEFYLKNFDIINYFCEQTPS